MPRHSRIFGENFAFGFYHIGQHRLKFFQARSRNDDGHTFGITRFDDPQEPSTRVFLQNKDKGFPLDLQFTVFERVLDNTRLWLVVLLRTIGESVLLCLGIQSTPFAAGRGGAFELILRCSS